MLLGRYNQNQCDTDLGKDNKQKRKENPEIDLNIYETLTYVNRGISIQ